MALKKTYITFGNYHTEPTFKTNFPETQHTAVIIKSRLN